MLLLDKDNVVALFAGYYHDNQDANFNQEMLKEKQKVYQAAPVEQTKNKTPSSQNRNDSSSIDSTGNAEQQSKFSNYQMGLSQLASSNKLSNPPSTNQTRMMKRSE